MKKPRKRYPPPGPCGVWFRQQLQLRKNKNDNNGAGSSSSSNGGAISTSFEQQQTPSSFQQDYNLHCLESQPMSQDGSSSQGRSKSENDISYSDAWSSMLQSLNIVTPYLNLNDPSHKKYENIRECVPDEYVLLYEILNGKHDLSISDPHRVLVQVHNVEARNMHHNIWTVQLTDETGSFIRAWLEPKYVQQQMQKSYSSSRPSTTTSSSSNADHSIIRPGVVWMLRNVSMIVDANEEDDEDKVGRILLISGTQIEQVWLPEDVDNSEEGKKRYLDFMERRKAVKTSRADCGGNENYNDNEGTTPDEEEEELMYRRQQQQQQLLLLQRNAMENITTQQQQRQQDEEVELDRFSMDAISTSGMKRMTQPPTSQHQSVAELLSSRNDSDGHNHEPGNQQSQTIQITPSQSRNNSDGHNHNQDPGNQQSQTIQITPSQPQLERRSSSMDEAGSTIHSKNDVTPSQQQLQDPSYHQRTVIESHQSTQSTYRPTTQDTAAVDAAAAANIAAVATCTQQLDQLPSSSPSPFPFDDHPDNNKNNENDENKPSINYSESMLPSSSATPSEKGKKKKKKNDRRSTKRTKTTEGVGDEVRKRARQRTPKTRQDAGNKQKATPTNNTPVSALWTTQDTSLIELFESSDDEDNSHELSNENDGDTNKAVAADRDNDEASSAKEVEDIFGKSADGATTTTTSIFDPKNLEGIDPSVFDEDE